MACPFPGGNVSSGAPCTVLYSMFCTFGDRFASINCTTGVLSLPIAGWMRSGASRACVGLCQNFAPGIQVEIVVTPSYASATLMTRSVRRPFVSLQIVNHTVRKDTCCSPIVFDASAFSCSLLVCLHLQLCRPPQRPCQPTRRKIAPM